MMFTNKVSGGTLCNPLGDPGYRDTLPVVLVSPKVDDFEVGAIYP